MVKVGDTVQYSPIIGGEFEPDVYKVVAICDVTYEGKTEKRVWVSGKRGCVAIEALRMVISD